MSVPDGAVVAPHPQPAPEPQSPRLIADRAAAEINAVRGFPIDQALTGFDLLYYFGEFLRRLPDRDAWQPWLDLAEARHRTEVRHHPRTVVSSSQR